jgi:4-aminobutyrate--pyruvate transaminase
MNFCQEHGLIVRAIGDSVALCPPYIVTDEQIEEIFDRFGRGLDATLNWARKQKLL